MIISVAEVKQLIDFKGWSDQKIERKLRAIEQTIRSYTNNRFQNTKVRMTCSVIGQDLYGVHTAINVGDTVQITESDYNEGLYVVNAVDTFDSLTTVDKSLITETDVLVTKIEYPEDVINCCVNLLEWEINNRSKVGIKSETLSRHSVTYEDSATMVDGYPKSLFGCLKPYRKCRC